MIMTQLCIMRLSLRFQVGKEPGNTVASTGIVPSSASDLCPVVREQCLAVPTLTWLDRDLYLIVPF